MKKNILIPLFLAVTALAGVSSSFAWTGPDPGDPDYLIVDSAVAYVGGIGVVPVNFVNDEELSALEVVLQAMSDEVILDSFSFVGGRVDIDDATRIYSFNDDSSAIIIFSSLWSTLIPADSGLLGKLYLSYPSITTPQVIPIDTTTVINGFIEHFTSFQGEDYQPEPWIPQFVQGYLDIQASPTAFDSIWVDNVEADPGLPVEVDIFYFNERNVAGVTVVLDYGSELLQYDSVSFTGTRGLTASSKVPQNFVGDHKFRLVLEYDEATPLTSGSGVLASLHFTVDAASPDTLITIDTATVGLNSTTLVTLTAADGNISFMPFFTAGSVDVQSSTDVEDITNGAELPEVFALSQNYPNPFNPTTNIEMCLPQASNVRLDVFNILGRKVRHLVDRTLSAGVHRITFDGRSNSGRSLASGIYFYRITTEGYTETKKMLLIK